jgi:hypothetical protein
MRTLKLQWIQVRGAEKLIMNDKGIRIKDLLTIACVKLLSHNLLQKLGKTTINLNQESR